jgi:hypothetical protein
LDGPWQACPNSNFLIAALVLSDVRVGLALSRATRFSRLAAEASGNPYFIKAGVRSRRAGTCGPGHRPARRGLQCRRASGPSSRRAVGPRAGIPYPDHEGRGGGDATAIRVVKDDDDAEGVVLDDVAWTTVG